MDDALVCVGATFGMLNALLISMGPELAATRREGVEVVWGVAYFEIFWEDAGGVLAGDEIARAGTGGAVIGFPLRSGVSRCATGMTVVEGEDLSGVTACAGGGLIAGGILTSFPTPASEDLAPILTERLWGVGETRTAGFIDTARVI